LAAQQSSIESECYRRGWQLAEIFTDEASGKSLAGREGLNAAIATVESGDASVLVVSKLDRLSRSLLDFASVMGRAQSKGWNLVALDLGIDLSTPAGEFLASVMASAAQWERRIIGVRTKEALAAKRAAGVRLGRPRVVSDLVAQRIGELRQGGATWAKVAEVLNEEGIRPAGGGSQWWPSTARTSWLAYESDQGR
jgi:DNA invertase Pin-like site-specific DNA recombinase